MKKIMKNKKSNKGNKVTIDKLAIMMNNSFDKLEVKIDTLEAKVATKEDLKNLEERMNGKFEGIDKRIDDFVVTRVKYEDFNKLKTRVSFIEEKLDIKNK